MREIYLIRHGMPDFPSGARMCLGRTDLPLGLRGRLQAALLGAEFEGRGVDECFCSRLSRSRQTAELMGCVSAVVIPGLEEMDAGDWDGLSFEEIRAGWPELYARRREQPYLPMPGAEPEEAVVKRFADAVEYVRRSGADAAHIIKYTGAAACMIGRGAFGNPWIFAAADAAIEGREPPGEPPLAERLRTAYRQVELAAAEKGERLACIEARARIPNYLHGVPHSGEYRRELVHISTLEELRYILKRAELNLRG